MKTLRNHTILFDAECPMCSVYTKAFVHTGMLDNQGRQPYQERGNICANVDMQRAVNEIALVDNNTGQVTYGVRSIFKVLGHSLPLLKPILNFKPFLWLMEKAYAFISYNRRVIIPANLHLGDQALQPTSRKDYRILYLLFTCFITASILFFYTPLLYPLFPHGNLYREYLVCFGQVFFQGMIAACFHRDKLWDYLGNMMTISFAGALLLFPLVILSNWIFIQPLFSLVYFATVVALMLLEHIRRSKLLHIGWSMTITWVIYRAAVLLVILKIAGYEIF